MAAPLPSIEMIFCDALEIADEGERSAFLDRATRGDFELRQQIEALLAARLRAGQFLESPAVPPTVAVERCAAGESSGATIGPYKLLEKIGEGGMGEVWMAEQREPMSRIVALKIIKAGMDTHAVVARFEVERQALALMDHPNIAKVFDGGTTGVTGADGDWRASENDPPALATRHLPLATPPGRPYFVMELVRGVPITRYCDEQHLTVRERLELFLPVCQAIQHAHQKGIIHRDIKPSNVLIAHYDGKPVPKIIDFGVAKAIGQRLTERTLYTGFGAVVGTLEYMSPEQAELNPGTPGDIDTRSDIYALGVLLYELLTGTTPLGHERAAHAAFTEMLRAIREEDPPKPSTRLSDSKETLVSIAEQRHSEPARLPKLVRGELDWIVMKALEKNRTRRYDTASGLAHDIGNYLHDEPVLACPPGASYRLKKFLRRNKGPVTAIVVVLLAMASGIVGTTRGMVHAQHARREAIARAAETQAVLDFVENRILAAARPEGLFGGLGPEITLKKAIAAALPFVATSFSDQPLIEARLRFTLGASFYYLGDAPRSMEQEEVALRLFKKYLGPDHFETRRCEYCLAYSYKDAGRLDGALALCEGNLAATKAKFGPDSQYTLLSASLLAHIEAALGRDAEAVKIREDTLARQKATLGPDHHDTMCTLYWLGESYRRLGRLVEGLHLHQEALERQRATLGPDHPDTLASMNEVASIDHELGRSSEALKLCNETLTMRTAKLGSDHPYTLISGELKAMVLFDSGRREQGLKEHEAMLDLFRAKMGPDSPYTLDGMRNLTTNYLEAGRAGDGLKLSKQALQLATARYGPEHPKTLECTVCVARCLIALDRGADALRLIDEHLTRATGKISQITLLEMWLLRLQLFAQANYVAGCRATVEKAEKLDPKDAASLLHVACMRAVAGAVIRAKDKSDSAAAAEAERAMAWLNQAVAAGYSNVQKLKTDKSLDFLRDRKDFQRLLADVEASAQP
jgi:non-specific serine/threonine protein kinase/serine/threonine-protein kinase